MEEEEIIERKEGEDCERLIIRLIIRLINMGGKEDETEAGGDYEREREERK